MHFLVFLFITFFSFAGPIANSSNVVTGKLNNGLSYYIYKNTLQKKACSIRMIVNTGSLNEKPEEKGLAHFLEHMVFRGTNKFCDAYAKDFKNYFGAPSVFSSNAITSFDTTQYDFTHLDVNDSMLEKLLVYVHEMMFNAKIDTDLLNKERQIVLSEKALDNEKNTIYIKQYLKFIHLLQLADHFPIGLESVIRSVDAQTMKSFYKREYQPEKMALIISSDQDSGAVLNKIQRIFSTSISEKIQLWFDSSSKEKSFLNDPDTIEVLDQPNVLLHYDPNLGQNLLSLTKVSPLAKRSSYTKEAIKANLIADFALGFFKRKLKMRARRHNLYFQPERTREVLGVFDVQSIEFDCNKGKHLESLEHFIKDVIAASKTNIDPILLNSSLLFATQNLQYKKKNKTDFDNHFWIEYLSEDYLYNFGFPEACSNLIDQNIKTLSTITAEDIQKYLLDLAESLKEYKHLVLCSTEPFNFSKDDVLEVVADALNHDCSDCDEEDKNYDSNAKEIAYKTQYSDQGIQFERKDTRLNWYSGTLNNRDVFTTTLENGLEVVLDRCKYDDNLARFELDTLNGADCVQPHELASYDLIFRTLEHSGWANFNQQEFQRYCIKAGIYVKLDVLSNCSGLIGTFKHSSLPQLFDIFHTFFFHRQFKKDVFDYFVALDTQFDEAHKGDQEYEFNRWLTELIYKNNPYYCHQYAKDADYATALNVLNRLMGNPKGYRLHIKGPFEIKTIHEYLLRLSGATNQYDDAKKCVLPLNIESGDHTFFYTYPQASQGHVYLQIEDKEPSLDKINARNVLAQILRVRLFDLLRVEQGKSYSQFAYFIYPEFHFNTRILKIEFDAQDAHIALMHEQTQQLLSNLFAFGISNEEFIEAKKCLGVSDNFDKTHVDSLIQALSSSSMLTVSKLMQKNDSP